MHSPIGAVAFAGMCFFDVSLLLAMFRVIVLGVLLGWLQPGLLPIPGETGVEANDEEGYFISLNSVTPEPAPLLKSVAKLTAIVLLLWLRPLPPLYFFS